MELALVQLDQVLGLAARAVQRLIDPCSRALGDVGDHEADVEAEPGCLDAGDGAALAGPGASPVAGLGIAPDYKCQSALKRGSSAYCVLTAASCVGLGGDRGQRDADFQSLHDIGAGRPAR